MSEQNEVPMTMFADVYDQNERISKLKRMAVKQTTEHYQRKLTDDEIVEMEHNLSVDTIKIGDIKQEFSDVKKQYETQLKPLTERINTLAECIKTGMIEADGALYYMRFDVDGGKIAAYDGNGKRVRLRCLTAQERNNPLLIEKEEDLPDNKPSGMKPNLDFDVDKNPDGIQD